MFEKVLDKKRKDIFKKLSFLNKEKAYLSGGTALAIQLGHRTSLDFDFYIPKKFDNRILIQQFYKHFPSFTLEEYLTEENTLVLSLDGVEISLFYYPYKLIKPAIKFLGVNLASIEDIAAMKLVSISQRGVKRDYIDLYYLIKKFGLEKIFQFTRKKYPTFNYLVGLKSLEYFEEVDMEKEPSRVNVFDTKINWQTVKSFIQEEVKKYQKKLLR